MPSNFPIYRARIVEVFAGTNMYRVNGPQFDGIATYFAGSSGTLGVRHTGGLHVGTQVLVALVEGNGPSKIVGIDQAATDPQTIVYSPWTTLPEPVSGYYVGSVSQQLLEGSVIQGLGEARNDSIADMVPGEWGMVSQFGAVVAVEHFRSYIGAGPMSELAFYTDNQLGRLRSLQWEHDTLLTQHRNGFDGNFAEITDKLWWTPADAVSGAPVVTPNEPSGTGDPGVGTTSVPAEAPMLPRGYAQGGPGHLGTHKYWGAQGTQGTPRNALAYDHLDVGGARVIGAAGGVFLERRITSDCPQDSDTADTTEASKELQATLETPRGDLTFEGVLSHVMMPQDVLDVVDGIAVYRARNAVDTVPQRWSPDQIEGTPDLPGDLTSMWGSLPEIVEIDVGAPEPKKFYVGRSVVALLPDGNIMVENSSGAQIGLMGPNIVLSCPGDIIEICGGTKQTFAGKNIVLKAYEHFQAVANTGRLDLKAEDQLSLLGGNGGGPGGVLIESRSLTSTSTPGNGIEATVGGLVLKSASGLYAAAANEVGVYAGDTVAIRAENDVLVDASAVAVEISDAVEIFTAASPEPVLSVSTAGGFGTLFVSGDLISGGNIVTDGNVVATAGIIAGDQIAAGGGIVANGVQDASRDPAAVRSLTASIKTDTDAVNKAITAYATAAKSSIDAIAAFENAAVPMSSQVFATLGFSFPQSADYGLPGNFKYGLPEMRWQQRSPSQEPWVENTVGTPAGDAESAAYPGYDIWFGSGEYLRAPKGLYFDITTGLSTLSQVSTNSASDPGSVVSVPAPTPLQDFVRS